MKDDNGGKNEMINDYCMGCGRYTEIFMLTNLCIGCINRASNNDFMFLPNSSKFFPLEREVYNF